MDSVVVHHNSLVFPAADEDGMRRTAAGDLFKFLPEFRVAHESSFVICRMSIGRFSDSRKEFCFHAQMSFRGIASVSYLNLAMTS